MIRATSTPDGSAMTLKASVSGSAIYLDNWAIGELAEGNPSRRSRFVSAIRSGMDLLFSVTNAAELYGPLGRSADAVRAFLDEIGPRWFPVELDATDVVNRELRGENYMSCLSENFLKDYLVHLTRAYSPGSGKIICLSDDFFRLGGILDWVGPQRDSIRTGAVKMTEALANKIREYAEKSSKNASWLDETFPRIPFAPSRRAYFVYVNLVRNLIVEASPLKPGDGMDFCHAVVASAFATFATLDKRWKRRIASLPTPNGLARIYYGPELDQMVTDIESAVAAPSRPPGAFILQESVRKQLTGSVAPCRMN